MLECSWAHTLSCLFVYCSFASIGHADIMWSHKIVGKVCLCCLFLCSIFLLRRFVCNAWSCAATISLSVSAFRSLFDSQWNVSSSLMSCLSIFLMYCSCVTLFFHFSSSSSSSSSSYYHYHHHHHSFIHSFIHLVVSLTTGPKPLPKRDLHIVRSRGSSFK